MSPTAPLRQRSLMAALVLAALSAVVLGAVPAASAADREPPARFSEQVIWVADRTDCPTPGGGSLQMSHGAVYASMPAADDLRRLWVSAGVTCEANAAFLSSPLPGPLDPTTWNRQIIVPPEDAASSGLLAVDAAEALFVGSAVARAYPAKAAPQIRELAEGEIVNAAPWTITGASDFVDDGAWLPVAVDGLVGWVMPATVSEIPTYDEADLTATLVPRRDVVALDAPAATGSPIGEIATGTSVPALLTPYLGYVPVAVDGQVGWVSQASLLANSTTEPPDPSATTTAPSLVDRGAEWLEEHTDDSQTPAAEPDAGTDESWIDRTRDKASAWLGGNPVAHAAAEARLRLAALFGLAALVAAACAAAVTSRMRRGSRGSLTTFLTGGVAPLLGVLAAPGAAVLALWGAATAPDSLLLGRSLAGAAVVGALVAYALADRIAAHRAATRAALLAAGRADALLAGGAGLIAPLGAVLGLSWSLPTAVVLGLLAAGVLIGLRARPEQRDQATTTEPDETTPEEDVTPSDTDTETGPTPDTEGGW